MRVTYKCICKYKVPQTSQSLDLQMILKYIVQFYYFKHLKL